MIYSNNKHSNTIVNISDKIVNFLDSNNDKKIIEDSKQREEFRYYFSSLYSNKFNCSNNDIFEFVKNNQDKIKQQLIINFKSDQLLSYIYLCGLLFCIKCYFHCIRFKEKNIVNFIILHSSIISIIIFGFFYIETRKYLTALLKRIFFCFYFFMVIFFSYEDFVNFYNLNYIIMNNYDLIIYMYKNYTFFLVFLIIVFGIRYYFDYIISLDNFKNGCNLIIKKFIKHLKKNKINKKIHSRKKDK